MTTHEDSVVDNPAPAPRTPDFLVIGAMKAATTSLCDWLDAQAGVSISRPKEPGIFISGQSVVDLLPHTAALFAHAAPDDLWGDGSTDYSKHPLVEGVPQRVKRAAPRAKLVYVMRHPVERAMSQYRFEWLLEGHSLTFEEAVDRNPSLIDNGRYAYQIRQWLEHFDREQFLLVFAEAYAANPASEVARVLDFLGVAHSELVPPASLRSNDSGDLVRPSALRWMLRDSAFGRALRPLVPAQVTRAYHQSLRRRSRPDVTPAVRARLETSFDQDLRDLQLLTSGPVLRCETWHTVSTTWRPALDTAGPPVTAPSSTSSEGTP